MKPAFRPGPNLHPAVHRLRTSLRIRDPSKSFLRVFSGRGVIRITNETGGILPPQQKKEKIEYENDHQIPAFGIQCRRAVFSGKQCSSPIPSDWGLWDSPIT